MTDTDTAPKLPSLKSFLGRHRGLAKRAAYVVLIAPGITNDEASCIDFAAMVTPLKIHNEKLRYDAAYLSDLVPDPDEYRPVALMHETLEDAMEQMVIFALLERRIDPDGRAYPVIGLIDPKASDVGRDIYSALRAVVVIDAHPQETVALVSTMADYLTVPVVLAPVSLSTLPGPPDSEVEAVQESYAAYIAEHGRADWAPNCEPANRIDLED